MAKAKTLDDLFHDTLKDIYYAERKVLRTLPKLVRGAESEALKSAFEEHISETEMQVERLQRVFEIIGKRAQGKTCDAIDGITAEGAEVLEEYAGTPVLDEGLIGCAQAVEHYEITRYGTLRRWATVLGHDEAARLLGESLAEEEKADRTLTAIAEGGARRTGRRAQ